MIRFDAMKTIIITGAGTGIGAATAERLATNPEHQLILIGRRKEKITAILDQLPNQEQHIAVAADIANKSSYRSALEEAGISERNVVGIFANAGIGGDNYYGDDDRWEEIIGINLTGTYISVMEVIPYLKASDSKFTNIVINSSCLARFGVPFHSAYCASKTGLLGLTKSLAVELGRDGILVNAICPGWVETEMARDSIGRIARDINQPFEDVFQQQLDQVPLGKMSQPSEIAALVNFLMTNEQSSMTGQSFDINNGSFMI
jgi:NAD(P)-dependent dehydrogenase (short-subunit alcohol dehydrogenase family)